MEEAGEEGGEVEVATKEIRLEEMTIREQFTTAS